MPNPTRRVSVVTLGCARNEVDSEELAGRLDAAGWSMTEAAEAADVVLVNTCGFVAAAKKDSIDTLLAAADGPAKVVAVGCLAERYGTELAGALPEAAAVLGFDSYADIGARLDDVLAGRPVPAHVPRDRRALLPISPAQRPTASAGVALPGHAWLPTAPARRRLDDGPTGYVKLASGCDRRCTFCAIPSFRGAFISRAPADLLAETRWLAEHGVREIVLVSENSTSYGKDLGDLRALENLLPQLAAVDGVARVRLSYLQPAELRASLLNAIADTPGVAGYFDLSFQHASAGVLRRMRRFGSRAAFLDLLGRIRDRAPVAGARSNVIVGFPGESEDDLAELVGFLGEARLDAVGVFGYSDEDGTAAAEFDGKLDAAEIERRVAEVSALADELMSQRAAERIGETIEVLVEQTGPDGFGRAEQQGPDTDGVTRLIIDAGEPPAAPGQLRRARIRRTDGVDLVAVAEGPAW